MAGRAAQTIRPRSEIQAPSGPPTVNCSAIILITNPETKRTYRVGIRGMALGENHCTCPDFAVNTLGTCKHIEFTLARLERRPGAKAMR